MVRAESVTVNARTFPALSAVRGHLHMIAGSSFETAVDLMLTAPAAQLRPERDR
ncbi:hypothetical protein [Streptomyces sp. NPDC001070]